jgi:glycosyltransferase involved in cell wall biosynthesis
VTGVPDRLVSVIIPARNEEGSIGRIVSAVRAQEAPGATVEVIVADDGSTDGTVQEARAAGARVVAPPSSAGGNPAAARNRGAAASRGDPLVFLDSDCTPAPGWLAAMLNAHDAGATMVGGALDMPPGLSPTARCDYYCGWYLIHSRRPAGFVPHHPPPNLSVRRAAFLATSGFTERQPFSYTNEERHWQAELKRAGHRIWFEPTALALHENRPGFINLLKRNYRWAYTALEAKAETGAARMAWLYRFPRLMIAASFPLAFAHTAYIVGSWLRAGVLEPLIMTPAILVSRFAYAAGMAVGGTRWLRSSKDPSMEYRPQWR